MFKQTLRCNWHHSGNVACWERPKTVNTGENKKRLEQVWVWSPQKSKSTRRLSAALTIPRTPLQRIPQQYVIGWTRHSLDVGLGVVNQLNDRTADLT
ncbi:hypothetical protein AVEN_133572-1 [Araneus ventricosus]|uniref:Uncharacterized protein n=1 Tax=Araneus ventricosus TaxID=182803 RepID=A0A4Y2I9J4_ARAVE|nr:hypothetical protein AVEN_133572-1 [Araneus ventricosus]